MKTNIEARLSQYGWSAVSLPDQLILEGVEREGFHAARALSTSSEYQSKPEDGAVIALLSVEGEGVVSTTSGERLVGAGELILLDASEPVTVEVPDSCARYLWRVNPIFISSGAFRMLYNEPIPLEREDWVGIASVINSVVRAPMDVPQQVSAHFASAQEHLLADLLSKQRTSLVKSNACSADSVLLAAQLVLKRRYTDPSLSVSSLAREVGVSERTLRRKYRTIGSTPLAEIRRRRVAALTALHSTGELSHAEILRAAGFTSAEQVRNARRSLDTRAPANSR